jgi:hypothetical protein|tara:strand:- start:628 stop:1356 length:729 start_codon:yes stop_codon:yes gene_type:complete
MINKSLADSCRSNYALANPFPHIVIDDFIPEDLALQCYNQMSQHQQWMFDTMEGYPEDERDSQVNKWWTPFDTDSKNRLESDMPAVWKCLQYFNSRPFLLFLENLTGIKDLIADVDFEGGGIHKIKNGGRLELHSDYNKHPNKDIWRRINLLLYLTPNWNYNGHLDLYEKDPLVKVKSILPTFNRAVIFNTTDDSIHGHPTPLVCPEEVSRYSFALYYFTKDRPEHEKSDSKAAIWYKTSYL